jgi:circadian clock protein KaiC
MARASKRLKPAASSRALPQLKKASTGIAGFDEISGGGLPAGRPTIVCGGPGCGKTMFAMEFLVRGATEFGEPGVLITFEETTQEISRNVDSLGFNLQGLVDRKKLFLDYVRIEPSEIEETGEYDLEGLFIRLQHAVEAIGAKRVVLDTVEAIFSGFANVGMLRAEIRRLFRWLKDRGLTTVVTAERGEGTTLTRYGLEEYVSDCVVSLDHRVTDQISTRRMRIVKYRGSSHGTDEYPFLIDKKGFSVLPLSSIRLDHKMSKDRISSGIKDLDVMLEGQGFFKASSILVSGTSGSGKSTVAAHFADATCRTGKRALFIALEESAAQVTRNMRSVGINLGQYIQKGLLEFHAWRPTQHGLEMHLLRIHDLVDKFNPQVVIVDPITNLISANLNEVHAMLRLLDFLKDRQITAMFTTLTANRRAEEQTEVGISSLTDTWILLRDLELNGERNRCLYVLKSRGMAHSNQIREFVLSRTGVRLLPAYVGSGTVYTGSARLAQEAREKAESLRERQQLEEKRKEFSVKRNVLESQIAALRSELSSGEAEFARLTRQRNERQQRVALDQEEMGKIRGLTPANQVVNS